MPIPIAFIIFLSFWLVTSVAHSEIGGPALSSNGPYHVGQILLAEVKNSREDKIKEKVPATTHVVDPCIIRPDRPVCRKKDHKKDASAKNAK